MRNKLTNFDVHMLLEHNLDITDEPKSFQFRKFYSSKASSYSGEWLKFEEVRDYYEPILDELFFQPILSNHPELKSDINLFWDELKHSKSVTNLLSEIFANKFYLSDVKSLVFRKITGQGNAARHDLLTRLIPKDPPLINDLQDSILNSIEAIKMGDDICVLKPCDLSAYIELLTFHQHEIKEKGKIKDCLLSINNLNYTSSQNSRFFKILSEVLPKNSDTLSLLSKSFSTYFDTQHAFRAKFQKYASYISGDSSINELDESLSSEEFTSKITLSERVLIDKYGISRNNCEQFIILFTMVADRVFEHSLTDTFRFSISADSPKHGTSTIFLDSDSYETHLVAKSQINNILNHFSEIASSYIIIAGDATQFTEADQQSFLKLVDSFVTKITLEDSLDSNKVLVNRKMKI